MDRDAVTGLVNEMNQPIGRPVVDWEPRQHPPRSGMVGRFCTVVPLEPSCHGRDLHEANQTGADERNWTYLFASPPESLPAYLDWLRQAASTDDPLFHAIVRPDGKAVGIAAYMRIDGPNGVIEVGHINYSPLLQRTAAGTEAMYLMMKRAFDMGYRRYEWKCDDLNASSRRAAERYGFLYEGTFRNAVVYKGRNRDTAWYALTVEEWPLVRRAFEDWLAPRNFDAAGSARRGLVALRNGFGAEAAL